jgi:hypothetical protein
VLIHITPKIYIPYQILAVELVSLDIPELEIALTRAELATRQPYPNKRYWTACKRLGQKAISGVLFETTGHVFTFTSVARWAIDGELLVTHTTNYAVLDDKYDCVTDNMILWYGTSSGRLDWERRWADWAKELTPARAEPHMEVIGAGPCAPRKEAHRIDRVSNSGLIMERIEDFGMLTVQRDRVLHSRDVRRVPSQGSAFQCNTRFE